LFKSYFSIGIDGNLSAIRLVAILTNLYDLIYIVPDVKLDEESEMIEEMTNPTLTSIDFSPTLKTIGICEYRANEHELVLVQMKRKIRAKIIADLKNHNMK
jgi:hypothetical protein